MRAWPSFGECQGDGCQDPDEKERTGSESAVSNVMLKGGRTSGEKCGSRLLTQTKKERNRSSRDW